MATYMAGGEVMVGDVVRYEGPNGLGPVGIVREVNTGRNVPEAACQVQWGNIERVTGNVVNTLTVYLEYVEHRDQEASEGDGEEEDAELQESSSLLDDFLTSPSYEDAGVIGQHVFYRDVLLSGARAPLLADVNEMRVEAEAEEDEMPQVDGNVRDKVENWFVMNMRGEAFGLTLNANDEVVRAGKLFGTVGMFGPSDGGEREEVLGAWFENGIESSEKSGNTVLWLRAGEGIWAARKCVGWGMIGFKSGGSQIARMLEDDEVLRGSLRGSVVKRLTEGGTVLRDGDYVIEGGIKELWGLHAMHLYSMPPAMYPRIIGVRTYGPGGAIAVSGAGVEGYDNPAATFILPTSGVVFGGGKVARNLMRAAGGGKGPGGSADAMLKAAESFMYGGEMYCTEYELHAGEESGTWGFCDAAGRFDGPVRRRGWERLMHACMDGGIG